MKRMSGRGEGLKSVGGLCVVSVRVQCISTGELDGMETSEGGGIGWSLGRSVSGEGSAEEASGTGLGEEEAVGRRFAEGDIAGGSIGGMVGGEDLPLGGEVNEGGMAGSVSGGGERVAFRLAECCLRGSLVP